MTHDDYKPLLRYACERCNQCSRRLTWIEIAFGRVGDPVCGACLLKRERDNAQRQPPRPYKPLPAFPRGGKDTQFYVQ